MEHKPLVSVIIVFYNMSREAPRTLFSLSVSYQQHVNPADYEVIALDCTSVLPLTNEQMHEYGTNFRLIKTDSSPSPASAINTAARQARGRYLTICIDGARLWSPGIMTETLSVLESNPDTVIATPSFHIGHETQNVAMTKGYNQETEDIILEKSGWETDGYQLFSIACPDGSSANGWFLPLHESNCLTVSKNLFEKAGGFDERFSSPGGGLANLDFFKKICEEKGEIYILAGEGTFHQFHGGVTTNIPPEQHPWEIFHREYVALTGREYSPPEYRAVFRGTIRRESAWMLQYSYDKVADRLKEMGVRLEEAQKTITRMSDRRSDIRVRYVQPVLSRVRNSPFLSLIRSLISK
jgi:hypothetical protein